MGSEVIVLPVIFGSVFGMYYLYISARNRERLALIEKGADATIFYSKNRRITPVWRVVILNLALLCIGIGLGIFLANLFIHSFNMEEDVAYPATIFVMAGIGLLLGFYLTKKMD
ncbi:DUF6249 domain-containing protein [Zunongwangia sp. F363]|uniref:DUF6249 domain-containing protein n=1 Tax=Autumnicola tepida TaxID=3075595 RepID=A0ABU3CDJ5_9FLAO|nr:DUF6249 domain-containing protein [Zunongwangia sp. F363]MDT0644409.1 DUF6249 domain-containing protein [Zunongwangia sp. F363]